jgi:hypothetical protein
MQGIPLKRLPNQEFSIQLDGGLFYLVLKTTGDTTSISVSLDGVQLLWNARAVANQYIISSAYQEAGNFMFVTSNFELPHYEKFGITQSLIYVTEAELGVIRASVAPPIVASDFSPYGDLPLRFKPQGYQLAP